MNKSSVPAPVVLQRPGLVTQGPGDDVPAPSGDDRAERDHADREGRQHIPERYGQEQDDRQDQAGKLRGAAGIAGLEPDREDAAYGVRHGHRLQRAVPGSFPIDVAGFHSILAVIAIPRRGRSGLARTI